MQHFNVAASQDGAYLNFSAHCFIILSLMIIFSKICLDVNFHPKSH